VTDEQRREWAGLLSERERLRAELARIEDRLADLLKIKNAKMRQIAEISQRGVE